jgi:hypothetical protein
VRPGAEPKLSTGVLRRDACGARCCGWSHEVRPSVMAEVRCGARGLGARGEESLVRRNLLVGRSVRFKLSSLLTVKTLTGMTTDLISDRLRVDSR